MVNRSGRSLLRWTPKNQTMAPVGPLMILPFNRSLVGARVERISSARAPEMCPFEKQSKNIKTVRRKLAAIFAADVAGYSRLMARDA